MPLSSNARGSRQPLNYHFRSVPMQDIAGAEYDSSVPSNATNLPNVNLTSNIDINVSTAFDTMNLSDIDSDSDQSPVSGNYVKVDLRNRWSLTRPIKKDVNGRRYSSAMLTRPTGGREHFRKGESIWMDNDDGCTWVGFIVDLYFDPSRYAEREKKRVILRWLYSAQDLPLDCYKDKNVESFLSGERFLADDLCFDDNCIDVIQGHAVLYQERSAFQKATRTNNTRPFHVRNFYTPEPSRSLRPLALGELKFLKGNVDRHKMHDLYATSNQKKHNSVNHSQNINQVNLSHTKPKAQIINRYERSMKSKSTRRSAFQPVSPINKRRNFTDGSVFRNITNTVGRSSRRDSSATVNRTNASSVYQALFSGTTHHDMRPRY